MKRLLALLAVAGTVGIGGNASATAGNRSSHLDDPAVIRRHDALGRLESVAPKTTSRPLPTVHGASAFDWSDAAVGFGSGIALIGFGSALRRRVYRHAGAAS